LNCGSGEYFFGLEYRGRRPEGIEYTAGGDDIGGGRIEDATVLLEFRLEVSSGAIEVSRCSVKAATTGSGVELSSGVGTVGVDVADELGVKGGQYTAFLERVLLYLLEDDVHHA